MKNRLVLFALPFLLTAALSCWIAPDAVAAPKAAHISPCGPPVVSAAFSQPPDIQVSTLPLNAAGQHEIILGVHRNGDRFCYRYRWNGATYTQPPTLHVRAGERFAIRIANDISGQSRGEFVASSALPPCMPMAMPHSPVVHYVGYLNHVMHDQWMPKLTVDTNIHLHGFQGPPSQENVFLSTLSTPLHACEYSIAVPRAQPPGTYFYHPHVHGGSGVEVAGGLSGVWIVDPATPQIAAADDHLAVLRYALPASLDNAFVPDDSDLYVEAANHQASLKGKPVAYNAFAPPPWPLSIPIKDTHVALDPHGCDGILPEPAIAVNGLRSPAQLDVPAGETQLLRLVNATSDSPKMLKLRDAGGKVLPMHVAEVDGVPVGGDLAHPLAQYVTVDRLMLPPASRASVLLTAPPGQTVTLTSTHYCEGSQAFFEMRHELLKIHGVAATAGQSAIDPAPQLTSAQIRASDTPAAKLLAYAERHRSDVRRRAITFTEYALPKNGKIPPHGSFFITDTTNANFHEHAYYPEYAKEGMVPEHADIVVKRGSIEEWYLFNTTMEGHVFHLHQLPFVEEQGLDGNPAMADTVFVPVGKLLPNRSDPDYPLVKPSVTKLLVDFRNAPRGTFVFHCHMLFHEDRGMMAIIRVV